MAKKQKPPEAKTLSEADRFSMRMAAAECSRLHAVEQVMLFQQKNILLNQQLEDLRLAQVRKQQNEEAQARCNQAAAALHHSQEEQRLLAKQIAQAYDVDWHATAFDPQTGLLVPTPEDSA